MKRFSNKFAMTCVALCVSLGFGLQRASADLSDGLAGYWSLNDGTGAVAGNKVAGGADGAITNADTGGPGDGSVWVSSTILGTDRTVIGFGGQAPADTAYVRAGDVPQMTLDNDFTWAFWSNTPSDIAGNPGQFSGIIGNRYQPGPGRVDYSPRQFIKFTPTAFEWHMNGNGNDNVGLDRTGDDPPGLNYSIYSADPTDPATPGKFDEWVHQAVVKDGTSLTYYQDGVALITGEVTQALDAPMPLWFGGDDAGDATENWQGLLAEVRTYDRALSADEVGDLSQIVPEPASFALLGMGALALVSLRRRRA